MIDKKKLSNYVTKKCISASICVPEAYINDVEAAMLSAMQSATVNVLNRLNAVNHGKKLVKESYVQINK